MVALCPKRAAADPSAWSDSDRLGDLVYFGLFSGASFASIPKISHSLSEGGVAVTNDVKASPSGVGGYQMVWWPNDFIGIDVSFEFFGLPLTPRKAHFDSSPTYPLRMVPYDGGGTESGPTVRFGIPLYAFQPNIGAGLLFPTTAVSTEDPKSRLNTVAFDAGLVAHLVGGINVYVSRRFRLYAEYQFDDFFASVLPGNPLDLRGLIRHSAVLGFSFSPEGFRKAPKSDRKMTLVGPFIGPATLALIFPIVKAAMGGKQ